MQNLESIICQCYNCINLSDHCYHTTTHAYTYNMTIPIVNSGAFEIPVEAMSVLWSDDYITQPSINDFDTIRLQLNYLGKKASYKSANAITKQLFSLGYKNSGLIKCILEDGIIYYGGNGIILDKDFHPILMLTWKVQRRKVISAIDSSSFYRYNIVNPVMRISPNVFVKEDIIQRYIASKLLNIGVDMNNVTFRCPYNDLVSYKTSYRVEVIIDNLPFAITPVSTPSINTNDRELLGIAAAHINEMSWV